MALEEILHARQEKLEKLRAAGIDSFPEEAYRTHSIAKALTGFGKLSRGKENIALAGRLVGLRYHGGAVFGDLKDASGTIQIFFKRDILREAFELLQYFDLGDFLSAEGILFTTQAREKTLEVRAFTILAKALRPLPSSWYGLEDVEERFRKRYLDLLVNPEILERFQNRSRIITLARQLLEKAGFIEVETPILQTLYGGAAAKPFKTQLDILHLPLYLRIAPELYLKRLIVAGYEKVYEIGKSFRNEGLDRAHNPEFTTVELYWAYQDREGLVNFCEEFFGVIAEKILLGQDKTKFIYQGKEISLARPWKRLTFSDAVRQAVGAEYEKVNEEELREMGEARGLTFEHRQGKGKIADDIIKKLVLPTIVNPTLLIDHPIEISPLAKQRGGVARRFQIFIGGWEMANAFAELNDPIEQKAHFEEQEKMRRGGDEEASPMDEDFIEALEYGMPPTAGLGVSIDKLAALLTDTPSVKEIILFPLLKPKR